MKKKILSLVLALSMVLSFFPGMTMTANAEEEGTGSQATWFFGAAELSADDIAAGYKTGTPGSLAAAFEATAPNGEPVIYVKLNEPVEISKSGFDSVVLTLNAGKKMVLDLGDAAADDDVELAISVETLVPTTGIQVDGDLTVKNGDMTFSGEKDSINGIAVGASGKLTVDHCRIAVTTTAGIAKGIMHGANGTPSITVSNSTIDVEGTKSAYGIDLHANAAVLSLSDTSLTVKHEGTQSYGVSCANINSNNCQIYLSGVTTISEAKVGIYVNQAFEKVKIYANDGKGKALAAASEGKYIVIDGTHGIGSTVVYDVTEDNAGNFKPTTAAEEYCVFKMENDNLVVAKPAEGGDKVTTVNLTLDNPPHYAVGHTVPRESITLDVSTTPATTDAFEATGTPGVLLSESNYLEALDPGMIKMVEEELGTTPSYAQIRSAISEIAVNNGLGGMDPAWVPIAMNGLNAEYQLKENDQIGMYIRIVGADGYEFAENVAVTLNETASEILSKVSLNGQVGLFCGHELGHPKPGGSTHSHCVCGADSCEEGHDISGEWRAWSATDPVPSEAGKYYLTENVTISSTWTPAPGTVLCLNGHVVELVDGDYRSDIYVKERVYFTLTDCNKTATHMFSEGENGLWVWDEENGTKSVNGGVITGASEHAVSVAGVSNDLAHFTMYGGNIVGNGGAGNQLGGGIYLADGDATIYGGSIRGNVAQRGAGICVPTLNARLNLFGGKISDNTATVQGGGIYSMVGCRVKDAPEVKDNWKNASSASAPMPSSVSEAASDLIESNVELVAAGGGEGAPSSVAARSSGPVIEIVDELDSAAEIGVTVVAAASGGEAPCAVNESGSIFTRGWGWVTQGNKEPTDYFFSDNSAFTVVQVLTASEEEIEDSGDPAETFYELQLAMADVTPPEENPDDTPGSEGTGNYPYGQNMTCEELTLYAPTTGTTYLWQKSADGTTWEDLGASNAASVTLTSEEDLVSGYWYRCVVDGVPTEAVQAIQADDETFTSASYGQWYLSNGSMAYFVMVDEYLDEEGNLEKEAYFDVVGKFKGRYLIGEDENGQPEFTEYADYWANTSCNRYWEAGSTSDPTPGDGAYANGNVESMILTFDAENARRINVEVKLPDNVNAFAFGTDTELGCGLASSNGECYADNCSLKAIFEGSNFKHVQMVAAESLEKADPDKDLSLVVTPITPNAIFWIGSYYQPDENDEYGMGQAYDYNKGDNFTGNEVEEGEEPYEEDINYNDYYLKEGPGAYKNYVTEVQGRDSALALSWTELNTDTVQFIFSVGAIADTGATSKPSTPPAPAKVTITLSDGEGNTITATVTKGDTYTLPECTFTAPTGKEFKAWSVNGAEKNVGDKITVTANTTITVIWEDVPSTEPEVPTYTVGGSVSEKSSDGIEVAVANAVVTLVGKDINVQTTTDENGSYSFENIPVGNYNIVISKTGGKTKTELVTVSSSNVELSVVLPAMNVSSVVTVETEENSPVRGTIVGNLDAEAQLIAEQLTNGTTDDIIVEIDMKIDAQVSEAVDEEVKENIDIVASKQSENLTFVEIEIIQTITTNNVSKESNIHETVNLLQIVIPFDTENRSEFAVYRYHEGLAGSIGNVQKITETANTYGERIVVGDGELTVYARYFSTYAIGYSETDGGDEGGNEGEETPVIPSIPNIPTNPNYLVSVSGSLMGGKVELSSKSATQGTTVTITVTPDKGYKLETLSVTDNKGNAVALTSIGGGKYTFVMPAGQVSISATFVKEDTSCSGDYTCPIWQYTDAKATAWYHDGVHYCIENGLMNGLTTIQFAPNGTTTRAQIVTILWRLEGQPYANYAMGFTDVAAGKWYTEAVRWAAASGIVDGYSATSFGPNDSITREQMVAILWRYCQYKGIDVSVGENTNILSYTDAFDVHSWAMPAMQWACGAGVIGGIADGNSMKLDPTGSATRAQVATMLQRFCVEIMEP